MIGWLNRRSGAAVFAGKNDSPVENLTRENDFAATIAPLAIVDSVLG